jgi:hypothetical protein
MNSNHNLCYWLPLLKTLRPISLYVTKNTCVIELVKSTRTVFNETYCRVRHNLRMVLVVQSIG